MRVLIGVFLSILFKLSQITVLFSLFNIIIIKIQYLINLIIKFLQKMQIEVDSPYCYYHPELKITNFCLFSQCLLPLCEHCVQIHRKQNRAGGHMSRIMSYKEAKNIAISSIRSQKQYLIQNIKQFQFEFHKFSGQLVAKIQKMLGAKKQKILKQNFDYTEKLKNFQQKIQNIDNNCLKQLISHYEYGKVFMNNIFHYQFQIDEMAINKVVEGFIHPKKLQQSLVISNPSFNKMTNKFEDSRKCVDCLNNSLYTQHTYSCSHQIQNHVHENTSKNKKAEPRQNKKKFQLIQLQKQNVQIIKSPSFQKVPTPTQKKKLRHGIFVASSPNTNNKLTNKGCSTQVNKSTQSNQNNLYIYEPNTDRNVSKNFNFKQHMQSSYQEPTAKVSLARPQSVKNSTSMTQVKKYQFPNKVIIIEQKTQKRRYGGCTSIDNSSAKSELDRKQKDWKDVVNKSDISQRSSSSRLILKKTQQVKTQKTWNKNAKNFHNQCLNPQQMRQLILKKRNIEYTNNYTVQRILNQKLVMNQNIHRTNINNQYKQRN